MIYGIKRGRLDGIPGDWVAFDQHRLTWALANDVPTPTTNLGQAQQVLAMVPERWQCEIVLLHFAWRRPQ